MFILPSGELQAAMGLWTGEGREVIPVVPSASDTVLERDLAHIPLHKVLLALSNYQLAFSSEGICPLPYIARFSTLE